ncbi:HoxN/HupN/NixA family nickel/cobalt transporter [Planctomonas deserti]|uniref:HoxN/HupN/NixA family nickel/cobalt transporter n=1 Tax=Planctomonas deserti TaxID=2144185 RepID=UPI00131EE450|nr:HoxN/HupN/NixA family nickel/cobalt transporter [Planctomonas deserti]
MTTLTTLLPATPHHRALLGISSAITLLHLSGGGLLFTLLLPTAAAAGGSPGALLGLAVGAYALGIRHAFDVDHIAAIDNATRQLISQGRESVSTGFWFALGHSSVVFGSVLILTTGVDTFAEALTNENSPLRHTAGIWGGTVSGVFLITAGALNLPVLRSLLHLRHRKDVSTTELHNQLERRGVLHRLFHPFTRLVDRPTRMYPVGFLFGLGLDTAGSISLFVLASTLTPGLPWYAALVLPVLFAAGMTLFDSADGILARTVYAWGTDGNRRTIIYNLIVTAVSVFIAFLIGGIGLLTVASDLVGSRALDPVMTIDLSTVGIGAVIFFALALMTVAVLHRKPTATSS